MVTTARGPIEHAVVGIGAPVLVLHGSPGGIDAAQLMAQFLPKDALRGGARLATGVHRHPAQQRPPSIDDEADLLAALLDELGIEPSGRPLLVGWRPLRIPARRSASAASAALVAFAAVSESYPTPKLKFIDRLLLQTRPGNKLLSYLAAKQPEQFVTGVLASEGSLSKQQLKERVAHVMDDPDKRDFVVGLGLTAEQTAERKTGYDNDIRAVLDIESLELERITAPTLVIHGTADSDVPYSHGVFAAAQIPGAELLVLDTGTHLAFYTHPDSEKPSAARWAPVSLTSALATGRLDEVPGRVRDERPRRSGAARRALGAGRRSGRPRTRAPTTRTCGAGRRPRRCHESLCDSVLLAGPGRASRHVGRPPPRRPGPAPDPHGGAGRGRTR